MNRALRDTRKEIASMKFVDTRFICEHGKTLPTNPTHESIGKNLFVELFSEVELTKLFGLKIFSRN